MSGYRELRDEVRAFNSDKAQRGDCKDAAQKAAFDALKAHLEALSKAHPEYGAMRMRREYYGILPDSIPVKLYRNSPFYFSVGINGGWGNSPALWFLDHFTWPVMSGKIPLEDRMRFSKRREAKFILCCGYYVDTVHHYPPFTRIFKDGFKGVYDDVMSELAKTTDSAEREFLETAAEGLATIHRFQLRFQERAVEMMSDSSLTGRQRKFMEMIADSAMRCPWEPPRSFYEGLNMFLFIREILALTDSLAIYALGHLDGMLNGLYEADVAAGRLTKDEAYDLICRFLVISDAQYDGDMMVTGYGDHELEQPVTIGGCDSEGAPIYNDITRFVLKAHRENDLVFPKIHCRVSSTSPKAYIRELAEDVWNGRCVHTLFNDDTIVPGLLKQGKTLEEARRYICAGCWNGDTESVENVDDANYFSLARVLEAMIYQDPEQTETYQYAFEALDDCTSPEMVRERVCRTIIGFMRSFMEDYARFGKFFSEVSPHPAYSACLEGCIRNRKDETAGGAKYSGRCIVLAFLANVVDSILAIRHVCFEKRVCDVHTFLEAVRHNWEGAEDLRALAMQAPYWGDGNAASMELGRYLLDRIRQSTAGMKNERGGDFCYSIWIYREFRYWGELMRALPDGRRNGDYLAQALNPSEFRNKEEITTTLNALACLDYTDFMSSNINLTFDKENMTPELLTSLFYTVIQKKLQVLQPNCFSRADLLDAQVHPEKHHNLIVKVCGFSARFVALEPEWQKAVLARYHY